LSATCLELAGIEPPACIQGQSFVPILKDPQTTIRDMVFAEQNWHVYKNHSRMVRFGDFVYIVNHYPDQPNLSSESDDTYPAGKEAWTAYAEGKTTARQQQIFANPCPAEELFNVNKDPDQLTNLAGNPEYAGPLETARTLIADWTEQTGDTVPENPTPSRYAPPQIENGKVISYKTSGDVKNPHAEMPGEAKNAAHINHPGPVRRQE
jgi:arylsulfatase